MQLGDCQISRCHEQARLIVTIDGHPNIDGILRQEFCVKHVDATAWDSSPSPYTVTIKGPFKSERS